MADDRLKVLIVGGYGTFGGRLVDLLADEARLTLYIAGRSIDQARAFCARRNSKAELVPIAFDRQGDVVRQLQAIAPQIVVDVSGPFQAYGGDPYRVVAAAILAGIDYIDLADGSDFVRGIAGFDAEARAKGVFIIAGASSFPALTAAVVRRLSHGLARIDAVSAGIAPSPYAGVGSNVIRAIASYAGQPVALVADGRPAIGHGLVDARRYTIAPPGRLPLRPTRFSLVDVPDLQVLPALWPTLRSVWMGAGTVPAILHRALNLLAWGVKLRAIPSLSPLAPLMYRVINVLRWGEHRGGMFVSVEGVDAAGAFVERSWHLLAEADHGPLIPSMAAESILRRCLDGKRPAPGARSAATEIELADYEAMFARRTIHTGRRESPPRPDDRPLYRRVLGEAWDALPAPIRAMHAVRGTLSATGRATVERGSGLLARLVAAAFGFPDAGQDVPVAVTFTVRDGRETWRRDFAGRFFSSTQEEGTGRFERLVCERFGPFAIGLALVVDGDRLRIVVRRWCLFGLPLPLFLAPGGEAYETVENGRFTFHVEIGHRLTGLIVRYRGWLAPNAI